VHEVYSADVAESPTEGDIRDALRASFRVLQTSPTADEMRERVVTSDFETGFVNGHMWRGPDGLEQFLAARAGLWTNSTTWTKC
jgi:hypothetical protein